MDSFITYEGLPVNSGGAHKLSNQPVDEVYNKILSFTRTYTNADTPSTIDIAFYNSLNKTYKTLPNLWKLIKAFGSLPKWSWWSFPGKKQHFWTWKLNYRQIPIGLAEVKNFLSLPENDYGPLVLTLIWRFKFVDPKSRILFPGQDEIPILDERQHHSQIHLRLGQKSTISVWFAFPFADLDNDAKEYFKSISDALPFKISNNHWRLWIKTKTGSWTPKVFEINTL